MSLHEELGLSLAVYSSKIENGDFVWVAGFTNTISSYSHEISAVGGFDSMNITIADDRLSLDEWIERGVGRIVRVFNSQNLPVWEGFVNVASAQMGGQKISVGPLMDMGNRVMVAYSPVDYDTSPPTVGTKAVTTIAENEESQNNNWIVEKVLSAGRITDDDAELIRDTFLAERAFPETSTGFNIGGSGSATLTLECLGAWYQTNLYVFNDTTSAAIQIHDRINDILDAEPNFAYPYRQIDTNNSIVPQESDEDKYAMAHLKELLAIGGAYDERFTLGMYDDFTFYYKQIPFTAKYKTSLSDQSQRIYTYEGAMVYPWDIRPAQWLFISDSLIGRRTDTQNLYEDPRYMFIEKVKYEAPWGLSLSGSRVGTYEQLLAKMGIGSF